MKIFFLMTMISLTLIACGRQDKPNHRPSSNKDYDNTGINTRDLNQHKSRWISQKANLIGQSHKRYVRQLCRMILWRQMQRTSKLSL